MGGDWFKMTAERFNALPREEIIVCLPGDPNGSYREKLDNGTAIAAYDGLVEKEGYEPVIAVARVYRSYIIGLQYLSRQKEVVG